MADLVARIEYVLKSEGFEAEPAAVTAVARMADGGFRDALTLVEQVMLTADGKLTLAHVYDQLGLVSDEAIDALLLAMKQKEVAKIMEHLDAIAHLGRDPRAIVESMLLRLADVTRAAYEVGQSRDATRDASLHEAATQLGADFALELRAMLSEAHKVIRDITLPRLWLESELIRIAIGTHKKPSVAATAPLAPRSGRPTPQPEAAPPLKREPAVEIQETAKPAAPASVVADPWTNILDELRLRSKTLWGKICESSSESKEFKVRIGIRTQSEFEWISERPKALDAIREAVRSVNGPEWDVELFLAKANGPRGDSAAVELPVEGNRLEQLVKEVFGAEPNASPDDAAAGAPKSQNVDLV